MKILFKWAGIFSLPSIAFFLILQSNSALRTPELQAIFFVLHFFSAGAAVFFTLSELKKKSIEKISGIRFIITGILSSVSHALIFGMVSGLYFNYFNPEAKAAYVNETLLPALIKGMDSTASTKEELFDHLMAGKDSGILIPEEYERYRLAAQDSLQHIDEILETIVYQNFSMSGTIIKWVGFAPVIGILFGAIVTAFLTRNGNDPNR